MSETAQPALAAGMDPQRLWAEKYAGRFAKERADEEMRREQAFLDLPISVCGEDLRQMTPLDLLVLSGVDNAFVCAVEPTPIDVGVFLWWLSVENDQSDSWRNRWRRGRLLARIRDRKFGETVEAIRAHVDALFLDSPGGGRTEGERRPLGTCFLAPLVHAIALETGWSERDILAKPLPRLFQYMKAAQARREGKEFVDFAPSDRLTGEFLDELNGIHNRN